MKPDIYNMQDKKKKKYRKSKYSEKELDKWEENVKSKYKNVIYVHI